MNAGESPDEVLDPLDALRRRWLLALVLVAVCAAGGAVLGSQQPTTYTSEARLVVGSADLDAYQVAGYAVASEALAANYARLVTDSPTSTDVITAAVGDAASDLSQIVASPIPNSNVVRIEVSGTDLEAATAAADAVAADLVAKTAGSRPSLQQLLDDYRQISVRVSGAQRDLDEARARETVTARSELETLRLEQSAVASSYQTAFANPLSNSSLAVLQPAALASDNDTRNVQLFGVAGAGAGLVLALISITLLFRNPRSPKSGARSR